MLFEKLIEALGRSDELRIVDNQRVFMGFNEVTERVDRVITDSFDILWDNNADPTAPNWLRAERRLSINLSLFTRAASLWY